MEQSGIREGVDVSVKVTSSLIKSWFTVHESKYNRYLLYVTRWMPNSTVFSSIFQFRSRETNWQESNQPSSFIKQPTLQLVGGSRRLKSYYGNDVNLQQKWKWYPCLLCLQQMSSHKLSIVWRSVIQTWILRSRLLTILPSKLRWQSWTRKYHILARLNAPWNQQRQGRKGIVINISL